MSIAAAVYLRLLCRSMISRIVHRHTELKLSIASQAWSRSSAMAGDTIESKHLDTGVEIVNITQEFESDSWLLTQDILQQAQNSQEMDKLIRRHFNIFYEFYHDPYLPFISLFHPCRSPNDKRECVHRHAYATS